MEPHLSTFAAQVPLVAGLQRAEPAPADNPDDPQGVESPHTRMTRAIEAVVGKYLKMEGHSAAGDLAVWLLGHLAPELKASIPLPLPIPKPPPPTVAHP